ncbi:sulfite exporter TauE/SafE family protein [Sulfurihydrogenibium azorense]|uniref:Probable membrane transporter protein n=1 Tax=Sulfurihydrogenibium azorense (strain DSM 15241 / OCM 825 / Az-Fu1) TaxID=204536 RepID=C1DUP1_SULAA|nr:sulfite exporter TauE/SafE family protein [Sulfurihydrogenibium azorense]ACN99791.1 membrane protein [Sulfurihydrogenibium azorense Az-Fu1]MDM7274234.1 sulfite exporter TauE/SafE family protein [Sulfurihydrogenibium azorense]
MEILLPIANVEVNVIHVLVLGFVVGVLSGMLGIGGGIILNPVLLNMNIPSVVVVGSSISQISGASLSGFLTYLKSKVVDVKMGLYIVVFGFIGGSFGVFLINLLKSLGYVKKFVLSVYVVYLLTLGLFILVESIKNRHKKEPNQIPQFIKNLPFKTQFKTGELTIFLPAFIGFSSGFLAAVMGIGGGNLITPALMYLGGYEVISAVSISIFQMVFVASFLAFFHSYVNHGVDIVLTVILILGSSFGAVFGAVLGQKVNKFYIKMMLAVLMIVVASYSLYQLIKAPPKEVFHLTASNYFAKLLLEQPFIYSLLVVVFSLLIGFIVSVITLRLKTFILEKLK